MPKQCEIDRLRSIAAHYRRNSERARDRARLIYCRALASHFEREAIELERVTRSNVIEQSSLTPEGDPKIDEKLSVAGRKIGAAGQ